MIRRDWFRKGRGGGALLDVAYGFAGTVDKLANEGCEGQRGGDCVRLGSWSSRHGTNGGYGTCEELDLFGRAALVECVGPALRLRLHHGVIVVPAKGHQNRSRESGYACSVGFQC